jgi:hypothetical protein
VHAYAKDTKHLYILEGIAYLDMEEDSYLVFEWLLLYVPSVNRFFFSSVIQIASYKIFICIFIHFFFFLLSTYFFAWALSHTIGGKV